jgi:hypothetical protein
VVAKRISRVRRRSSPRQENPFGGGAPSNGGGGGRRLEPYIPFWGSHYGRIVGGNRRRDEEDDDQSDRRSTLTPLGVPHDYRVAGIKPESFRGMSPRGVEGWSANGQGPNDMRELGARYFDGDQYRPGQYPIERIIDMQRRMAIAGFLDLDDIRLGVWTGKTVDAYEDLLGYANQVGLDADSALYHAAQAGFGGTGGGGSGGSGGGGGGSGFTIDPETGELIPVSETFVPPALELRTTNKDDLRRVFRQAVTQSLGQGWSEAQINELVDAYVWKEIQVQKAAYDTEVGIMRDEFAGTSEGGQMYVPSSAAREVEMPSPDTFIEATARERDPAGFQATQVAEDFAPAFFQALQGYN